VTLSFRVELQLLVPVSRTSGQAYWEEIFRPELNRNPTDAAKRAELKKNVSSSNFEQIRALVVRVDLSPIFSTPPWMFLGVHKSHSITEGFDEQRERCLR